MLVDVSFLYAVLEQLNPDEIITPAGLKVLLDLASESAYNVEIHDSHL